LGYPGCFEEEVLSRPVESYFEPPTINEIFKMNYRRFLA